MNHSFKFILNMIDLDRKDIETVKTKICQICHYDHDCWYDK